MNGIKKNPIMTLVFLLVLVLVIAAGYAVFAVNKDNAERQDVYDYALSLDETATEDVVDANYDAYKEMYDAYEETIDTYSQEEIDEVVAYAQTIDETATEDVVVAAFDVYKDAMDLHEEVDSETIEVAEEDYPVATIKIEDIGTMKFKLDPMNAPQSTYNFISLAESGFYDGLTIHRIEPGFVFQGGDPSGDGSGGPGYSIVGEFPSNGYDNELEFTKGTLAWAKSGTAGDLTTNNTAGSQFFVTLSDDANSSLQDYYAPFGQIISGEELLDDIAKHDTTTDADDTLTITSVSVNTKGIDYPEPIKLDEE